MSEETTCFMHVQEIKTEPPGYFEEYIKLEIEEESGSLDGVIKSELSPEYSVNDIELEIEDQFDSLDGVVKSESCPGDDDDTCLERFMKTEVEIEQEFIQTTLYKYDRFKKNIVSHDLKCTYCPKTFPDSSHLKIHLRNHAGEKPCDTSRKSVNQSDNLEWTVGQEESDSIDGIIKTVSSPEYSVEYFKSEIEDEFEDLDTIIKCGSFLEDDENVLERFMKTEVEVEEESIHTTPYKSDGFKKHIVSHDLKCTYCPKTFIDSSHLKNHLRSHAREKPCDISGKLFNQLDNSEWTVGLKESDNVDGIIKTTSSPEYSVEYIKSEIEDEFEDLDCESTKLFKQSDNLEWTVGERRYACKLCNGTFARLEILTKHMAKQHNKKRLFKCEICNSKFTRSCQLSKHKLLHSEKLHICELCDKGFTQLESLKMHIYAHTGKPGFNCEICGRHYKQSCHLRRHMIIHTGESRYACKLCKGTFTRSESLRKHMALHTGKRPFKCEICKKTYIQSCSLKKHLLVHTRR
ncbi:zinc finger protein 675-like [Ctenocephalides felis]|uniref:zinc finger protein 675-like n=1 Tax=Ctenocephalides felis TaxID=7515 RepID=UPI000E6E569A|nr:zinc finger protein 675-like [Ctenocephalides felis]